MVNRLNYNSINNLHFITLYQADIVLNSVGFGISSILIDFLEKKLSLKKYNEVLRILVNMLFEKYELEEGERKQKISDLIAQDKVYTLEKALLQMYVNGELEEILKGTKWEKCTKKKSGRFGKQN